MAAPLTIAITGGCGFVGLSAAEALLAAGHRVRLLDLGRSPLLAHPALAGAEVHACDTTDEAALAGPLAGADLLLHLAALTPDAAMSRDSAAEVVRVNVAGTAAALTAAARAGIGRAIVTSSIAVYGTTPPWPATPTLTETAPLRPDTLYGVTRVATEGLVNVLAPALGIEACALRLGPLFGPWEAQGAARPNLSPHAQILALGARASLPHEMRADWLYSRDAGAMIARLVAATGLGGRILNLGAGALSTPGDWAALSGLPRPAIDPAGATVTARTAEDRPPLDITALGRIIGPCGTRPLAEAAADHARWRAQLPDLLTAGTPS